MNTVDEKVPFTLGDRGRSQNLRVHYEALVVFSRILGFLSNEETRTARKWQLKYGSDAPQYSAQVPASWIKSDKNFSLSRNYLHRAVLKVGRKNSWNFVD